MVIPARCIWLNERSLEAYIEMPGGVGGLVPLHSIHTPVHVLVRALEAPALIEIDKKAFLSFMQQ